jgi:glycosyltransferase involved in cell wall biosynthesis
MPRLVSAILARNEADRFLRPVLARLKEVSDDVLLLDDNSTDATADVAADLGCTVMRRSDPMPMWGRESGARQQLWDWGTRTARDGWLLIADADMLLVGDPRPLLRTTQVNSWSFILYDVWGEGVYRSDGYWKGHEFPRPWLFCPSRVPSDWVPWWAERGIHCGHAPNNFPHHSGVTSTIYWEHLQYSSSSSRLSAYAKYAAQFEQMTPFEVSHASSILDPV